MDELKELAEHTIDGARGKLLDILCNYQGMKKCQLIAVFDAYRVQGHVTECLDYHNIRWSLHRRRRRQTSILRSSPTKMAENTM